MLTLALSVTVLAVLCWPGAIGPARLRAMALISPRSRPRLTITRPGPVVAVFILGVAMLLISGLGASIAAVVAAATAVRLWRRRDDQRRALAATEGMANALRGLVAELRAGASASAAAAAVAEDADPESATVLTAVASAARLGGDLDQAVHNSASTAPHLTGLLAPFAAALTLARRHGLPMAEVLDSVRRDVDGRLRFTRQVRARMAGPRASGTVLAVLPILGVLLGQLMGASPAHVLLATTAGQLLLPVGTVLVCVGLLWIGRLTSQAVTS